MSESRKYVVCADYDPNQPVGTLTLNPEAAEQLRRKALVPALVLPEGEVAMLGLIDRTQVDTAPDSELDGEAF